jgi:hypothetical protein
MISSVLMGWASGYSSLILGIRWAGAAMLSPLYIAEVSPGQFVEEWFRSIN